MATRVGIIIAEFIAKTGKFVTGTQRAGKSLRKFDKSAKATKKLLGTLFAVGTGLGVVSYTKEMAKAIRETDRYARALNVPIEQLSAMGFAVKSVGIENEKFNDILKDLSDKIGDAYLNKGGEAKEALENLGLSAAELNRLNPADQLLEIAGALDNIETQGGRVQVLESIANDASLLLPLLENNGEAFKDLIDRANELNIPYTQADADLIYEITQNTIEWDAATEALGRSFAINLLPRLVAAANWFGELANDADDFFNRTNTRAQQLDRVAEIVEEIGGIESSKLWDFLPQGRDLQISDLLSELSLLQENLQEKPLTITVTGGTESGRQTIADMREELKRLESQLSTLTPEINAMVEAQNAAKAANQTANPSYRDLINNIGQAVDKEVQLKERIDELVVAIGDQEAAQKRAFDATIEGYGKSAEGVQEWLDKVSKVRSLVDAYLPVEAAQRRYNELVSETKRLVDDLALSENNLGFTEEKRRLILAAAKKNLDDIVDGENEVNSAAKSAGYAFESAFGNAIIKGEELSDVLASLADDLARLVFQETAGKFVSGIVSTAIKTVFAAKGAVVNAAIPPGVYSSPTFAPTSSPGVRALASGGVLFGEAGTEAVIPLPNGRSVPVEISGGRGDININNYTSGQVSVSEDDSGALQIDILEAVLSQRIALGGSTLSRALEGTYRGMRR